MTASEFILHNLSFTDMTGWMTYIFLAIFFVVGILCFMGDRHLPAPFSVSFAVMAIITPLAWLGISAIQYSVLTSELGDVRELEHVLERNGDLISHPYLIELNDHKEDMVEAMKDNGDFGQYESTYEDATSLTNVWDYAQNEHAPFFVANTAKVCFKTGQVPESIQELVSIYPFSTRSLSVLWEKESYNLGILNPACTADSVMQNIN